MSDWLPLLELVMLLGCLVLLGILLFRQRDQRHQIETDRLNQELAMKKLSSELHIVIDPGISECPGKQVNIYLSCLSVTDTA